MSNVVDLPVFHRSDLRSLQNLLWFIRFERSYNMSQDAEIVPMSWDITETAIMRELKRRSEKGDPAAAETLQEHRASIHRYQYDLATQQQKGRTDERRG